MKIIKFKTNINCGSCVKGVTPFLSQVEGIKWEVDTSNDDNILSVEIEDDQKEEKVIRAVKKAGFSIEKV